MLRITILTALAALSVASLSARPRARDAGIPFDGTPGPLNAITDVQGVEVGHVTLIAGDGPLEVGRGPVRTGVTAILPRGKAADAAPVFAGTYSLNGNGEMTGTAWIEESGFLEGPILLTNTHSVGVVRDAIIAWQVRRSGSGRRDVPWSLPVVAETWDGWLSDINGFHVKPEHVFTALDDARNGPVPEGSVGGGTGMVSYEFKGGIGTASRRLAADLGGFTLGVLVQANHGVRRQLVVAGVPVGREIGGGTRRFAGSNPTDLAGLSVGETGSILIIVATDAPLLPHQLKRLARRAALGLARTGAVSGNGSGDLFLAFSTAPVGTSAAIGTPVDVKALTNEGMSPLFESTVEAVEEAIINALVAGETMTGRDGHTAEGVPIPRLQEILKQYNRLVAPAR
ncbi:DmpA family aminopeptidase [Horticoccus sp. 23ND18S-11]|uniref:DmpA family aminopeptidase n=1 Tax=Horticoccus sp. 23ND18S-11 TaxID=3391832 RepID=UPI0039C9CB23